MKLMSLLAESKKGETEITITVKGNPEDVKAFLHMCSIMNLLGRVGASRTLKVFVDGDGSGRLDFELQDGEMPKADIDLKQDDFSIGIGC